MIIDMEFIKAQLARRKEGRQLVVVSKVTGVSKRSLHRVMRGKTVRTSTVEALQKYLKENSRKANLDDIRKSPN